jgi:hypothetical protein
MINIIPMSVHLILKSFLKKIEIKDNEKKLQITSEHVPVSVSIFSNVPEFDVKRIFVCNGEPKTLIKKVVQTILNISLKAKSINQNKYSNIDGKQPGKARYRNHNNQIISSIMMSVHIL